METFRTLIVLCLCLVLPCALAVPGYPGGRTCSRSFVCRKGECCRDHKGNLLGEREGFGPPMLVDSSVRGRCSRRPSGPGQVCNPACGCTIGHCCPPLTCWTDKAARKDKEYWANCSKNPDCHTCYKTVTGVCCPPPTCWTDAAAKKDKDYWAKCFSTPGCPLPQ